MLVSSDSSFITIANFGTVAWDHKAADRDLPLVELFYYHEQHQNFENLQFLDTMVGHALHKWNSPAGIPLEV